jgi:hypothetical protein
MVQTSLFLSQVWRGNVDVNNLLYQLDPNNPNHEDIVSCTDYVVGYQMKGAQTLAIERKNMKYLVMNMEYLHLDNMGMYRTVKTLLNRASVYRNRSILKQ